MRGCCLVIACALACGPTIAVDAEDESTTTIETTTSGAMATTGDTTSSTTNTGAATEVESTSTSSTEAGDTQDWPANFIGEPDSGSTSIECDVWHQDCPPGEKCMPWANDGGNGWNATRCSPIAPGAGQPGDPCTVEGSGVSGVDTCDVASMCWNVDPDTDEGTCIAFCFGSPNNPVCEDPETTCSITSEAVLNLCLPTCDPLAQDCPDGQLCVGIFDDFICAPDASGEAGAYGDSCENVNVCDPGLLCAYAAAVPGCGGARGCCTPYCDVDEAVQCPGEGQTCVPLFEPGQAPPQQQDVGICAVAP